MSYVYGLETMIYETFIFFNVIYSLSTDNDQRTAVGCKN